MSTISEIRIMELVDILINKVDGSVVGAEEFIVTLCTTCVDLALKEAADKLEKPDDQKKMYKFLYFAIERIDQLWVYAGAHMREKHDIDLFRYGALVLIRALSIPEKYSDIFNLALDDYANMLDSKTPHSNKDVNGELLREYFTIMNELGIFHIDPCAYETEHQKDLAHRMVEIYYNLVGIRTEF